MESSQIRSFTDRYLKQMDCQILEATPDYLITQLSIDADKDILNRPFYWMYVEKTGLDPQPAAFCFIFNRDGDLPEDLRGELLFHGSPRLSQMIQSAQKHGRYVRLYQSPSGWERFGSPSQSYTPWIGINFKVSYLCDRQKDRICSLGINLRTGEIKENFYTSTCQLTWTHKLPPQRHITNPRITVSEAVGELEYFLQEQLEAEDSHWAQEALERLELEWQQLEGYYPDDTQISDELLKEKKQRKRETIWQYHPRIEVSVINAGMFYME